MWVILLAVTVGAVVTAAAAFSSAGACAGSTGDPALASAPDDVCYQLVRSMAERTGVMAAAVTAILVLTMVGLSRMVDQEASGGTERFP